MPFFASLPLFQVLKINFSSFFLKNILPIKKKPLPLQTSNKDNDSVAQLVEQMTLNHWVESSSLSGVTKESSQHNADCFFRITRKREHKQHFGQKFQLIEFTHQLFQSNYHHSKQNRFSPCKQIPILYLVQKINPAKKISKTYQEFSYIWKTICPDLFYTMDKNSHCWAEERNKQ